MKQLLGFQEMLGKKISRVENFGDTMYIFFTDDSYAQIIGGSEYLTGEDFGIDYLTISQYPLDMETKYSLYLISEEEYDAYCEEEDRKDEEQDRVADILKLKMLAEKLNVELPKEL